MSKEVVLTLVSHHSKIFSFLRSIMASIPHWLEIDISPSLLDSSKSNLVVCVPVSSVSSSSDDHLVLALNYFRLSLWSLAAKLMLTSYSESGGISFIHSFSITSYCYTLYFCWFLFAG